MKWPKALLHPPGRDMVERWGAAFSSLASANNPTYLAQVLRGLVRLSLTSWNYRYSLSLVGEFLGRVGEGKMNMAFGQFPLAGEVWTILTCAFRLWAWVGYPDRLDFSASEVTWSAAVRLLQLLCIVSRFGLDVNNWVVWLQQHHPNFGWKRPFWVCFSTSKFFG